MIYRVHEGKTILWPDGNVRARGGECFDGNDTGGTPSQNVLARGWLRGQWTSCVPMLDGKADESCSAMPDQLFELMREAQRADGVPIEIRNAPATVVRGESTYVKPKGKASKKKAPKPKAE